MPDTTKPKMEKPKPITAAPQELEVPFTTYSYPCALCGKAMVAWTVTGKVMINIPDWATIPLKHEVCGQEIELSMKVEDLLG